MAQDRKQLPLRLSNKLFEALQAWAEEDFRSINGQIEYLLTEAVNKKYKGKFPVRGDASEDETEA